MKFAFKYFSTQFVGNFEQNFGLWPSKSWRWQSAKNYVNPFGCQCPKVPGDERAIGCPFVPRRFLFPLAKTHFLGGTKKETFLDWLIRKNGGKELLIILEKYIFMNAKLPIFYTEPFYYKPIGNYEQLIVWCFFIITRKIN